MGGRITVNRKTGSIATTTDLVDLRDIAIVNPADGEILVYDSATGKWVNTTENFDYLKLDQTTPQTVTGGIPVSVQATAPDNPVAGVLYVNSTDHKLYIYYNNSWQELHELAYTPPTPAVGSPFGLWLGLWRTYN
jgi:hypothetical protein